MRRIETDGGTIVGMVDRVARKVRWSLLCHECSREIPLDVETFKGKRPPLCQGCGWKQPPLGTDLDGRPTYYDFTELLERAPEPAGISYEMGF